MARLMTHRLKKDAPDRNLYVGRYGDPDETMPIEPPGKIVIERMHNGEPHRGLWLIRWVGEPGIGWITDGQLAGFYEEIG